VPAALVESTARLAAPAPTALSPRVHAWAQHALEALASGRLRTAGVGLVAFAVFGIAIVGLAQRLAGRGTSPPSAPPVARSKADADLPPRLDRQGDPLPPDVLARLGTIRLRHGTMVSALAISPDGKVVASSGDDNLIRLWDPGTGKELKRLKGHDDAALAMAFARDGKTLVSVGRVGDSTVCVWDPARGKLVRRIDIYRGDRRSLIMLAALSRDTKTVAVATLENKVRICDVSGGKEVRAWDGPQGGAHALALSPDGKNLAVAGQDGTIQHWATTTGRRLGSLKGHRQPALWLAFAPDGRTLVSRSRDRTIRLWDPVQDRKLRSLPGPHSELGSLAWSPDGRSLVTGGSDSVLHFWNAATGKETRHFSAGGAWVHALSTDGKMVAAAGRDNVIRLWNATSGKEIIPLGGHQGALFGVVFAADGKTLATRGLDQTVRFWEAASGRELGQAPMPHGAVLYLGSAPGFTTLIQEQRGRALVVWDVAAGKKRGSLPDPWPLPDKNPPAMPPRVPPARAATLSPDGKTLAVAGPDQALRLWSVATGKQVVKITPSRELQGEWGAVLFAPDGKTVITGTRHFADFAAAAGDGAIAQWDIGTGKELRRLTRPGLRLGPMALSPDGRRLLAAETGGAIRLWDLTDGRERYHVQAPLSRVYGMAFAPDGRTFAAAGAGNAVFLWETSSARLVRRLIGHHAPIIGLAFSPDGTALASASEDSTALVWDLTGLRTGKRAPIRLSPADLDARWTELADPDPAMAHPALWSLAAIPTQAVPFLKAHLHPVAASEARRIDGLIRDLDSRQFAVRRRAAQELERLESLAEPALRGLVMGQQSVEVLRRAEELLDKLARPIQSPEVLRSLRAVKVLEHVGTAKARRLLALLAKGAPEAWLTQEACASLRRLSFRR
jgi:WD40 repeat protein